MTDDDPIEQFIRWQLRCEQIRSEDRGASYQEAVAEQNRLRERNEQLRAGLGKALDLIGDPSRAHGTDEGRREIDELTKLAEGS